MILTGIFSDLSNADYHADKDSISRSGILLYDEEPFKYWSRYLRPDAPVKEPTAAMEFGTAVHSYVLEYPKFHDEFIIEPELLKSPKRVLLKNVGRPAYEAYKSEKAKTDFMNERMIETFYEAAETKKIITVEQMQVIADMNNAICDHAQALEFLSEGVYEQSYFWQDAGSGLMVKARPDCLKTIEGELFYVDLKTCNSSAAHACSVAIAEGGLHIQGAMVRDGVRILESREVSYVVLVFIEKTYPYSIACKIIKPQALDAGETQYKNVLKKMALSFQTNEWASHPLEEADLPFWYYQRHGL